MKQADMFHVEPPPPTGWPGALEGMTRAKNHAEREAPKWSARARAFLERYLAEADVYHITGPAVREWAESRGLDKPASNYAWGAVFLKASRDRRIVADGFGTYGNATMHTQPIRLWRRA